MQITNELFRQILEQRAIYALEKPIGDTKNITATNFIGAMMQPGRTMERKYSAQSFCCLHNLPV